MKKIIFSTVLFFCWIQVFSQNTSNLRKEISQIIAVKNATVVVSCREVE